MGGLTSKLLAPNLLGTQQRAQMEPVAEARNCKLGWTASASQKSGSWQQAAVPSVFSQPLIKLWDSFYSCAVLEKLEARMDLHDSRVCPWADRRGNC